MGARSVHQLYPLKSFIPKGPLKRPVLSTLVWNDPSIWRPWLFSLRSTLRRVIYVPLGNIYCPINEPWVCFGQNMQLTFQESHFPFPLNASCVCTIGRFVIYMADWKLLQRVKMDLLMRKVKACTIIIFYIVILSFLIFVMFVCCCTSLCVRLWLVYCTLDC